MSLDVIIIGGGISGLALGHYLKRQGVTVLTLEKEKEPGGFVRTVRRDGFVAESGPNGLLEAIDDNTVTRLIYDLGLQTAMVEANPLQKQRYIYRALNGRGGLLPVPTSPWALLKSPLLSWRGKLRLLREPFIKAANAAVPQDETLGAFVRRRLGREVLDYMVNPAVTGIYAGDPEELSAQSAFPRLVKLEQEHGSLIKGGMHMKRQAKRQPQLFSFRAGMHSLIEGLAESLGPENLQCQAEVSAITYQRPNFLVHFNAAGRERIVGARRLVMATAPHQAGKLLKEVDPRFEEILRDFSCAGIVSLTLGFKETEIGVPLDGFGFLVPASEKLNLLGVIWSSTLFPQRAPLGYATLTCMFGGRRHPEHLTLDNHGLLKLAAADLKTTMGITATPSFVSPHRWPRAIPQYGVGHAQRAQRLAEAAAAYPGLDFTGNYIDGISVAHCVARAETLARQIRRQLWNRSSSSAPGRPDSPPPFTPHAPI